jgi:hypothetical protein
MGLSTEQRDDIRNFLLSRGLAFKPLLDEMSDHIGCDLENMMNEGMTYEGAWKHTISQLPEDHFKQIQKETMETINQRFTLSRVFTYVAIVALFGAAVFKILHLKGIGELWILSFLALTVSLVSSSVSGIYFNRDKEGAFRVLGLVIGTIIMMLGYTFKIAHLPGADQLIIIATLTTLVAMVLSTLHAYSGSGKANLFTFLHEKYTPGIERFLLLLIIPIFFSKMVHIVLCYAAGLQFIALVWRQMYEDESQRNVPNVINVLLACICLLIPMLADVVPLPIRLMAIVLFNFVGVFLSLRFEKTRRASSYLVFIAPVMFTLTSMVNSGWMPSFAGNIPVNVVVCAIILAGIYLSPKHSALRTFMILSLGYLLEL